MSKVYQDEAAPLDERVLAEMKPGFGWSPWQMAAHLDEPDDGCVAAFERLTASGDLRVECGIHYRSLVGIFRRACAEASKQAKRGAS